MLAAGRRSGVSPSRRRNAFGHAKETIKRGRAPAGSLARLARAARWPAHPDAQAVPGSRYLDVVRQPGDDGQAEFTWQPLAISPEGACGRPFHSVVVRGGVGHDHLEPLASPGQGYPDGFSRAMLLVHLDGAEHASPTARRTSSSSASATPLRLATAVATSRAVRTCAGSGVNVISTVAIGYGRCDVTSPTSGPRWPRPRSRECRRPSSAR